MRKQETAKTTHEPALPLEHQADVTRKRQHQGKQHQGARSAFWHGCCETNDEQGREWLEDVKSEVATLVPVSNDGQQCRNPGGDGKSCGDGHGFSLFLVVWDAL